jgi:hypothetical protein
VLYVDRGPEALTRSFNDWLYSKTGSNATMRALKFGGIPAVRSATADAAFTPELVRVGFEDQLEEVNANLDGDSADHAIWFTRSRIGADNYPQSWTGRLASPR